MDIYKVRAWNKKEKRWISAEESKELVESIELLPDGKIYVRVPDLEFDRYTWRKDTNGKEIYENDEIFGKTYDMKVTDSEIFGIVEYNEERSEFMFTPESLKHLGRSYALHNVFMCEVVSNVHENELEVEDHE